jgi:hypothetical protein
MNPHLETAFKLGSCQAAHDFEAAMREAEYDNPTAPPPKFAGVEIDMDGIVRRVHEKLSAAKKAPPPPGISRTPSGRSGNKFEALKKKLKAKGRK